MDWSRTKTIFIVTFLLLNTFLIYQLIEKRNEGDINVRAQATVKERLADMNITVTEELPEDKSEISHIVGQTMDISEEVINKAGEEQVTVLNNRFIEVTLEDPYKITDPERDVENFLRDHVVHAEEYSYTSWNQDEGQMFFNQTFQEHIVVTYAENQLVLFFNEDQEIVSYIQSYLEFNEEGKEKDMLAPYKAIEVLLNEAIISFNDEISQIELGYYSLFSPEGDVQVFAPMYQIQVNEESSYLVHAIDGSIQESIGDTDNIEGIQEENTAEEMTEETSSEG
ncbi:two-component system regulatory protein YycI [Alteribacillus iranensis]|uniref:Two-component signal transduction system YycFG, regulatory protein YycI n=1 Tax=Alteribacillus iranensis TaxID=930128 RepID=A0A1I2C5D2_9BACI|nr:two-component system regulatory protein YycI [Alteribacillus iranensis]SFE63023.1 Two-component signal transduction system YycFG, regulatory protein YycI [Alteribacillus iranensis]